MKRVLSTCVVISMLCCTSMTGNCIPKDNLSEIIETVRIEPNIKTLLENEVRETRHWDEGISDNTITITYPDAQLLMMVASAEALNQGPEGMVRVMEVILNRVASDEFPDTVQEVVYQKSQFESVTNGSIYRAEITPEVRQALAEVEKKLKPNNKIIAFETAENGKSLEKYFEYSFTQGDHDFFTTKKN